ncbi:hypothetical protein SK128_004819 [Halocaridina rubra]|uniref:Uncharacterized protein n=1 Tax=Halocaridina rubra TaxID=373956 RepID=A0AAN8XF81_HALRR
MKIIPDDSCELVANLKKKYNNIAICICEPTPPSSEYEEKRNKTHGSRLLRENLSNPNLTRTGTIRLQDGIANNSPKFVSENWLEIQKNRSMPSKHSKQASFVNGSTENVHRPQHDKSEPRQRTAETIDIYDDSGRDSNSNNLTASSTFMGRAQMQPKDHINHKNFQDDKRRLGRDSKFGNKYAFPGYISAEHKDIEKIIIEIELETQTIMKTQRDIQLSNQEQLIKINPISNNNIFQ